jgi:hypothetical protein
MKKSLIGVFVAALLLGAGFVGAEQQSLDDLKKILGAAIEQGDANKATLAVNEIARLNSKEAVQFLINVGLQVDKSKKLDEHGKWRVFDAARQCLPKITDKDARAWIFKEAKKLKRAKDADKKVFLTEVITRMEGPDAEEALIPLLQSRGFQAVIVQAADGLGRKQVVAAVTPLIDLLEERERIKDQVWRAADDALVAITGHRFNSAMDWKNFWTIRGPSWDPKKDRGEEKAGGQRTMERKVPTFFEKEILDRRPVFIIDISRSMHVKDPAKGGEQPKQPKGNKDQPCPVCKQKHRGIGLAQERMRVERVKNELVKLLDALDDSYKFNILAFSTDVLAWRGGDELIQATDKNLNSAKRWVQGLTYEQYTSTDRALERAFAHREANAFFLLSDGAPYRDKAPIDKKPIFEMVDMKNKTRKVKIFTFGFSEDADDVFLKKISSQNGGEFTEVK